MPIHLSRIPRRRFLGQAILAGAGLLTGCATLSSCRRRDKETFALFSDIHLDANPEVLQRNVNMARNFEQAAAQVTALPRLPEQLFITGDLAHNSGQSGDYATLSRLTTPLREAGIPIHLALGNHDNRDRFWEAFQSLKSARRPVHDHQVALVRTPKVDWFILDSLETTLSTPGLLGTEQLDWLARSLDADPAKPAIVLIHHNPGISGTISGLKDSDALLAVIHPRRRVKAYIFGHTHKWSTEQDAQGLHLINLPPVAYPFRDQDPSGWVLATLRPDGMNLALHSLNPSHPAHGKKLDLPWRA